MPWSVHIFVKLLLPHESPGLLNAFIDSLIINLLPSHLGDNFTIHFSQLFVTEKKNKNKQKKYIPNECLTVTMNFISVHWLAFPLPGINIADVCAGRLPGLQDSRWPDAPVQQGMTTVGWSSLFSSFMAAFLPYTGLVLSYVLGQCSRRAKIQLLVSLTPRPQNS